MMYLIIAALIFAYMTVWFVYSNFKKRNDLADTAWGLGFVFVAWASFCLSDYRTMLAFLVNVMVTLWGTRLALHIHNRNKTKPEDKRYKDLIPETVSNRWLVSYLKVFLLQGLFMWLISLPVQFINFSLFDVNPGIVTVGVLVWVFGFVFEVVADKQLASFLKIKKRSSKVLDTGLWRFTRHPNYFGEVTLWWGVFLIVSQSSDSWWTVLGPLTITILILFVSGIPMLEKRYQHDENYQAYKAKTSIFVPWFSKSR